jgi:hypothetical protein
MFSISQDEMLAGLEHMEEHKQVYYDAHCPNCRRANRVERARMERFFPDWKKAIKKMARESAQVETADEKKPEVSVARKAAPVPVKASTRQMKHSPATKKPVGAKKK